MPGFRAKGPPGPEDGAQRTTFRPPWVKEAPPPIPMPSAPWAPRRRDSAGPAQEEAPAPAPSKVRTMVTNQSIDGGTPRKQTNRPNVSKPGDEKGQVPSVKGPPETEKSSPAAEKNTPATKKVSKSDSSALEENIPATPDKGPPTKRGPVLKKTPSIQERPTPPQEKTAPPNASSTKEASKKKVVIQEEAEVIMPTPPPPPAPPPPPPPPKFPGATKEKAPLPAAKVAKLDSLRSRPRRRPDWTDLMKDIEGGVSLRHVKCDDRSAPVLPEAKAKGQFVYESETDNAHNKLLKEIQSGVRLKKVKCNDRSKPILGGLRKFRRQMTLEEQTVQKCASMADVVAMAAAPDELDDIDKVRDDLQSTKQMLAHELRNKEALERENKRLQARLLNLEVELEKEKASRRIEKEKGEITAAVRTADDDKLIVKLKDEAAESSKMMKDMENMYKKTAEELDVTRAKLEKAWLLNTKLEQELSNVSRGGAIPPSLTKQMSSKKMSAIALNQVSFSSSEEESVEEEESEEDSDPDIPADNSAASQEKRIAREIKLLTNKHRTLKEKRQAALKEKFSLKDQFSKLSKSLRQEEKKYKALQKEVDKMAKLVKDIDDDEEEEEEEDAEEEEVVTESESESEESEEEVESEGEAPESANSQEKIANFSRRIKVLDTRLTTLKKSNYLLKANIDRRQDELSHQRESILSLQEDLNNVLAELG